MPPVTDQLDLKRLGLKPGGGVRFKTAVRVGGFVFGAQCYQLAVDPLPVLVDASRTTSGFVIRLRAEPAIKGPCMRCSDDFSLSLAVDHSEVHEPALGAELASEYVSGNEMDLAALVRDAVGLALPPSISGRFDGGGRCRECGRSRDDMHKLGVFDEGEAEATVGGIDAIEREPDPRWAKLRELEL